MNAPDDQAARTVAEQTWAKFGYAWDDMSVDTQRRALNTAEIAIAALRDLGWAPASETAERIARDIEVELGYHSSACGCVSQEQRAAVLSTYEDAARIARGGTVIPDLQPLNPNCCLACRQLAKLGQDTAQEPDHNDEQEEHQ